ncbi:uncharacterized protein LOC135163389 isoform X2 [Diachasmimorpha longicaudata]|uniref:uncharacterized protein LOC135163389 isoform X2 n=1 Tax=Diachasmimorpha longicaudata TaxID=58733 RepID=UPI0030B8EDA8
MSSPKRQKIVAYTEEQLQQALSEVKKNMSIRHAARKFHIPYSTLLTKVKKLSSPRIHKRGHVRILSQEHEEQLVQGILHRRINGFPITKRQIYDSITALFKALKIITCFPDNGPGATWYKSFRKRHKLTETTLQNVDTCRKAGTEESLKNWFTNVKNFLGCRGLLDIDASRVFNCDEAGFILTPRLKKGLVRRKEKTDYSFIPGDENECVAAMICGNAEGQLAPPLVMLSCARMSHTLTESVPELWAIGKSGNGWTDTDPM